MKRTPMPPRSTPLQRSTWNPDRQPLARRTQLERRTPLAPVSQVRAAARDVEAEVRAAVFARDGRCLLDHLTRVAGRCMGRATFHHLLKANVSRYGYTFDNGVCLCERHNGWVEVAR